MGAVIRFSDYKKNDETKNDAHIVKFKGMIREFNVFNYYERCCLCMWDKGDIHFFMMRSQDRGGRYTFDNILPLCLNHIEQLEDERVYQEDLPLIQEFLWTVCNDIALI